MKIKLHIGTHKTGTTFTQNFLYHNRELLASKGILYPTVGIAENAHHILGGRLIHDLHLTVFSRSRRTAGRELGHSKISEIAEWKQIKSIADANQFRSMILSTEQFEWLSDPSVIADFLAGHEVEIVVYLRRQDSYLASLYQTLVSDYPIRARATFSEWLQDVTHNGQIYDYEALLGRWEGAFGAGAINAFVFEVERAKGLEKSVCENLEIPIEARNLMMRPQSGWGQKRRESIDWRCLEMLRLANVGNLEIAKFKNLHRLVVEVSDALRSQGKIDAAGANNEMLTQIMHSVTASNNNISHRYLRGLSL